MSMGYLPTGFTVPPELPHERPFWEYARARELRIQQCADCGRFRHPPQPVCQHCRSFADRWTKVDGTGMLYSYTIVHQAAQEALRSSVPYNVAVVLLDGTGDVRLISNVIDVAPGDLRIGMPLALVWEMHGERTVPRFRRAG